MIGATPAEQLQRLSEIILRGYWQAHPGEAQWLGLHEYDGQVPNFQAAAVSDRVSTIREQLDLLGQIDRQALGPEQAIDLDLLRSLLESERFYLWELREQERNPLAYSDAVDLSPYLKRNYAPLEERARRLGRHARLIPTVIDQARENLREPMPRTFIDTAIGVFEGTANFIRDEVPAALKGIEPPVDLPDDLAKAADAVQGFVEFLRAERERATDDFAIGAERFREMLRSGEMIDVPLDRLLEIGQRDLERNLEAARDTARQIDAGRSIQEIMADMSRDHPDAAQLIPETTRMLEDLRQFLIERAVVTIPSEVRCRVEETPSFMRWAFAMMDAAGPFETQATESYYYVTPPEADWPAERREEWLS
ncbi:MAG: DUF885 family protein, partial [Thermomicrobiaceae bacterium]|nr:DUF885 family protein [Thermomicrobiaceae bacterium]